MISTTRFTFYKIIINYNAFDADARVDTEANDKSISLLRSSKTVETKQIS